MMRKFTKNMIWLMGCLTIVAVLSIIMPDGRAYSHVGLSVTGWGVVAVMAADDETPQGDPSPAAEGTPAPTGEVSPSPTGEVSPTPTGEATPTPDPSGTPAPTATPVPTPELQNVAILYTQELVKVKSKTPVYYAVLKKDSDKAVKAVDLIPAARDFGSVDEYYIDISTVSASKKAYLGIASTNEPDATGMVAVLSVPLLANERKVVIDINWAVEGDKANGIAVIRDVIVTAEDGVTVTYKHSPDANKKDSEKDIRELETRLEWRKGSNCAWKKVKDIKSYEWESLKNSGALIYLRLAPVDNVPSLVPELVVEGFRCGKETKIKFSITKAPSIKLDVNAVSLALKNGMQFRKLGYEVGWSTILPYIGTSVNENYIKKTSSSNLFDPYVDGTKVKIATLSVSEIKQSIGYVDPVEPTDLVLELRIAATTKKPASRIGKITIPAQGAAPVAEGKWVKDEKNPDITRFRIEKLEPADKLIEKPVFEYFLCLSTDVSAQKINMATAKWSAIKLGSEFLPNLSSTYRTTDGASKKCELRDAKAVLLIRRKGVTASAKSDAILASEYLMIKVNE